MDQEIYLIKNIKMFLEKDQAIKDIKTIPKKELKMR